MGFLQEAVEKAVSAARTVAAVVEYQRTPRKLRRIWPVRVGGEIVWLGSSRGLVTPDLISLEVFSPRFTGRVTYRGLDGETHTTEFLDGVPVERDGLLRALPVERLPSGSLPLGTLSPDDSSQDVPRRTPGLGRES